MNKLGFSVGTLLASVLFFDDCKALFSPTGVAYYGGCPFLRTVNDSTPGARAAVVLPDRAHVPAAAAGNYICKNSSNGNIYKTLQSIQESFNNLLTYVGAHSDGEGGGLSRLRMLITLAPDVVPAEDTPTAEVAGGDNRNGIGATVAGIIAADQVISDKNTIMLAAVWDLLKLPYANDTNSGVAGATFASATCYGVINGEATFARFLRRAVGFLLNPAPAGHDKLKELVVLSNFVIKAHNEGKLKTYVTDNGMLFPEAAPGAIRATNKAGANVNFLVCMLARIVGLAEGGEDIASEAVRIPDYDNAKPAGIGYTPNAVLAVALLFEAIMGL
ncbi:MAG: hypothetical protein LBJ96_03470 [Holosporaceae bacterium]|jgi:hypothetical protein|nr:hypothetical protein [Holosporaceae bacterium]